MNILTREELEVGTLAPRLKPHEEDEEEEETFLGRFDAVELFLGESLAQEGDSGVPCGDGNAGSLHVSTRRVFWIGAPTASRVGFAWAMKTLALHAISRDLAAFPKPCIYCQLDLQEDIAELRLVPSDLSQLEAIYKTLSQAAELNPDDEDEEEEEQDGEEDGWIYNEEEVENGAQQARLLAQLDSMLHVSPAFEELESGQFDDADEEEQDDDKLL